MSRSLRLKQPLIVFGIAAAACAADALLVGLPGPCGGSGLLDTFFQPHPLLQAFLTFAFFLGAFVCLLSVVWLVAVLVVRVIERA